MKKMATYTGSLPYSPPESFTIVFGDNFEVTVHRNEIKMFDFLDSKMYIKYGDEAVFFCDHEGNPLINPLFPPIRILEE